MKKQYSKTHRVKINSEYYERIVTRQKRFEIRKNDRDYQVGDWVYLREYHEGQCTGSEVVVKIIYVTHYEQKEGYVVFGFTIGEEDE